jgi:hypothetical protein
MPIITLQKINKPVIVMAILGAARDWAKVARTIIANSIPYIFLRPSLSASHPNPNIPITVPPEVAALIPVLTAVGSTP